MTTATYFERIQSVESEFVAASVAVERMRFMSLSDPTILHGTPVSPSDLRLCQERLESTYVIRMFAEFENALRQFWKAARNKAQLPRTQMEQPINSVAAKQDVPSNHISDVHEVREYRNSLLHGSPSVRLMFIGECRTRLCKFLSFFPHQW